MKTRSVLFVCILLLSSYSVVSGEVNTIIKKQPLIIHGSTGSSLNFHTSNESFSGQSPVDWSFYGNYMMQIFGIDLPFSFTINQFSQNYTHPFTQFGISPTYKWAKVHLGISNIQLSKVSAAGHAFNGVGIELTPEKIRFSAFYGRLNLTGIDDTISGSYERPKYSGVGYGVKLGIGSIDNYIDLSYFHGRDDGSSSINNSQKPFENEVIGMDFKVKFRRVASLAGSFAVSGSTKDKLIAENDSKSSGKTPSKGKGIFSTYDSGNIPAWALESAFSLDLKNFRSVLSYRKVQSDFKSSGTLGTLNDGQTISLTNGFSLAKGKLNINTIILQQSNDENRESTGDLNAIFGAANMTLSGNLNFCRLHYKDLFTGDPIQNNNLSASLAYDWRLAENSTNFSLKASYERFVQSGRLSSSLGATMGAGADVLKNKKLNLNGTVSYIYNKYTPGDSKGNISVSLNAGYHSNQKSFNFFVNYSVIPQDKRYNPFDYMPYKTTTQNLTAGISYTLYF
jgi:hypothetical protein